MKLFVTGLNHKTAPIALREKVAVPAGKFGAYGYRARLTGNLTEAMVLSTCNRVEIYGVTDDDSVDPPALLRILAPAHHAGLREHSYLHVGDEAVRHLMRVASGLDSMVFGETDITGQVKAAYQAAHAAGHTGPVLNPLFQKALQTAKEIRTRTAIGRGPTSVGSLTLTLAEKIFGDDLSRLTVMVVGAGSMATTCLRHFTRHAVASFLVCNRSIERARELIGEVGGEAVPFEGCFEAMARADIVITTTGSPNTLIHRADMEAVMHARAHRPLFLVDIAVPRDVDAEVQDLEGVYLYNLEDLEELVRANVQVREMEMARCAGIIDRKAAALMARFERIAVHPPKSRVCPLRALFRPPPLTRPAEQP